MPDFTKKDLLNKSNDIIPTRRDSLNLQKNYLKKEAQLKKLGYVRQTSEQGNYTNIDSITNKDYQEILKKERDKVQTQIIKNGYRQPGVYPSNVYREDNVEGKSYLYKTQESERIGVLNPEVPYSLYDKRIAPTRKDLWLNESLNDGIVNYGYDFGEKYAPPVRKTSTGTRPVNKTVVKKNTVVNNKVGFTKPSDKMAMGGYIEPKKDYLSNEKSSKESEEFYNHRMKYKEFLHNKEKRKGVLNNLYYKMKDNIDSDKNPITNTLKDVITSPIQLGKNLANLFNINNLNKYKTNNQSVKEKIELGSSALNSTAYLNPFNLGAKAKLSLNQQILKRSLTEMSQNGVENAFKDNIKPGKMNMNQYADGGQLTHFNEGGLHEENPNGGVPVGGNNTVEQGETKKNNYVYSNRLYINEDLAKQFNLPFSIRGKTFADASKIIEKPFIDKSSTPDKLTLKEHLDRLRDAQEDLKSQEQQRASQMAQEMTQNQVFDNTEVPEGMEEFVEGQPQDQMMQTQDQPQTQSKYGGFVNKYAEGGVLDFLKSTSGQTAIGGAAGALGSFASGDTSKGFNDIAKTGLSIGANALLPGSGALVAPLYDAIAPMFTSEDTSIATNAGKAVNNQFSDKMKYGGFVNELKKDSGYKVTGNPIIGKFDGMSTLDEFYDNVRSPASNQFGDTFPNGIYNTPNLNYDTNVNSDYKPSANSLNAVDIKKYQYPVATPIDNMSLKKSLDKSGTVQNNDLQSKTPNNTYANMLRYAPIAANVAQGLMMTKPETVVANQLTNRYKPNYLDENTMLNQVKEQSANTAESLTNAAGGSDSALRAGLLANNIGSMRGRSEAYSKMREYNNAQDEKGQTFDLGIDQANINLREAARDNNAQNQANYRTKQSQIIGQTGTDLGNIGKESLDREKVKEITGYDTNGKYVVAEDNGGKYITDKDGKKVYIEEPKKSKYGGFLKTNKKGY